MPGARMRQLGWHSIGQYDDKTMGWRTLRHMERRQAHRWEDHQAVTCVYESQPFPSWMEFRRCLQSVLWCAVWQAGAKEMCRCDACGYTFCGACQGTQQDAPDGSLSEGWSTSACERSNPTLRGGVLCGKMADRIDIPFFTFVWHVFPLWSFNYAVHVRIACCACGGRVAA